MWVELLDGRVLGVPLAWFPRLLHASPSDRAKVKIIHDGLHWEEIDEDISIDGLVAGRRDNSKRIVPTISGGHGQEKPLHVVSRTSTRGSRMPKDQLFVERRPQGDYAVRRGNAERASAVLPTQAEAIDRARELNPNAAPLVERVRHTDAGTPDKWRKP
jgi:hypothetical protein